MRTLCSAYVELFRNVPLLLQLFIWYFILTETLPPIEEALRPVGDVFFSKNGLQFPVPVWSDAHIFTRAWALASGLAGCVAVVALGASATSKPPVWRGRCCCRVCC